MKIDGAHSAFPSKGCTSSSEGLNNREYVFIEIVKALVSKFEPYQLSPQQQSDIIKIADEMTGQIIK